MEILVDGRPIREVLSYSRRGSRFSPRQAAAWEAHHAAWVIPEEAVEHIGIAREILEALAEAPDGILVEVKEPGSGIDEEEVLGSDVVVGGGGGGAAAGSSQRARGPAPRFW